MIAYVCFAVCMYTKTVEPPPQVDCPLCSINCNSFTGGPLSKIMTHFLWSRPLFVTYNRTGFTVLRQWDDESYIYRSSFCYRIINLEPADNPKQYLILGMASSVTLSLFPVIYLLTRTWMGNPVLEHPTPPSSLSGPARVRTEYFL